MGNNHAFSVLEASVISAYNLGKLDEPLLRIFLEVHRGTDIDQGGSADLVTKDGKSCVEVIVQMLRPALYLEAQKVKTGEDYDEDYWEAIQDAYHEATKEFEYW